MSLFLHQRGEMTMNEKDYLIKEILEDIKEFKETNFVELVLSEDGDSSE